MGIGPWTQFPRGKIGPTVIFLRSAGPIPTAETATRISVDLTQDGALAVAHDDPNPKTLEIMVSNAGAATMPFAILLSNLALNINP